MTCRGRPYSSPTLAPWHPARCGRPEQGWLQGHVPESAAGCKEVRHAEAVSDLRARASFLGKTAVATLAIDPAHRHGFQKLKEACFEFVSGPENYGFVQTSKWYAEISWETISVERDVWAKYCERSRLPCDASQVLGMS